MSKRTLLGREERGRSRGGGGWGRSGRVGVRSGVFHVLRRLWPAGRDGRFRTGQNPKNSPGAGNRPAVSRALQDPRRGGAGKWASSITGTPRASALASLEPGDAPATSADVLPDTEETTVPPRSSTAALAAGPGHRFQSTGEDQPDILEDAHRTFLPIGIGHTDLCIAEAVHETPVGLVRRNHSTTESAIIGPTPSIAARVSVSASFRARHAAHLPGQQAGHRTSPRGGFRRLRGAVRSDGSRAEWIPFIRFLTDVSPQPK